MWRKNPSQKTHLTQFILQFVQLNAIFVLDIWKHLLSPIAVCFQQMSFHSYNVPFCPIFGRIKFNIWDIKGRTYCIQWTPVETRDPTVLPLVCFDWRTWHDFTCNVSTSDMILITVTRNYYSEIRKILHLSRLPGHYFY